MGTNDASNQQHERETGHGDGVGDGLGDGSACEPQAAELSIAELYALHSANCLRAAQRVTHDHYLAEDAVQDAFLNYLREAHRFDRDRASIGTWLVMLSYRRAVDLVRRESVRPRPEVAVSDILARRSTQDRGSEWHPFTELIGTSMRRGLVELSVAQRHVLFLTYYLGYNNQQAAALMGVPLGTVKSRLKAALTVLRRSARPEWADT